MKLLIRYIIESDYCSTPSQRQGQYLKVTDITSSNVKSVVQGFSRDTIREIMMISNITSYVIVGISHAIC